MFMKVTCLLHSNLCKFLKKPRNTHIFKSSIYWDTSPCSPVGSQPRFRRDISSLSSGSKDEPSKKPAWSRQKAKLYIRIWKDCLWYCKLLQNENGPLFSGFYLIRMALCAFHGEVRYGCLCTYMWCVHTTWLSGSDVTVTPLTRIPWYLEVAYLTAYVIFNIRDAVIKCLHELNVYQDED
jgi:hypothetical protein